MPRANSRRTRKKGLSRKPNLTTITINSVETAAYYGFQPYGTHGIVKAPSFLPKWSDVVINPRAFRKGDGEISR